MKAAAMKVQPMKTKPTKAKTIKSHTKTASKRGEVTKAAILKELNAQVTKSNAELILLLKHALEDEQRMHAETRKRSEELQKISDNLMSDYKTLT
jgi:hypothetical protein